MPIIPFDDRPKVDMTTVVNITTAISGGIDTTEIDMYRQGVSVKTTKDFSQRILPFIYSSQLPKDMHTPIDHSIDRTTYGYVELFIDSDDGITIAPFNDIASLNDPVKFLQDTGITAYPQVMLSPNFLDPGMMNGIIEPLGVRGILPGSNIDSPFTAHGVRAEKQPTYIIEAYFEFESVKQSEFDNIAPFIDSAPLAMHNEYVSIASEGIADFDLRFVGPLDAIAIDDLIKNDLKTMKHSVFNDIVGLGIIRKGMDHGFVYRPLPAVELGLSGIRNSCNVDSLAFGGLLR